MAYTQTFAYDYCVRNREPKVGVFGEKFRKQREERGLELDAISNTTKISTRMLRALEDEHFDQLPGGVFNKGFVRAYARQIGLNEEEAVADYLAALRESQIQQQSILPDFRSPASRPNAPVAPQLRENVIAAHSVRSDDIDDAGVDEAHHEDRGTRTQDKDFSPSIVSPPQPRERFPQKYPAGSPGDQAVQSSAPVPWGKLALTLLVVTAALAIWNFRRHAQPAPASQPVASNQSRPAPAPARLSTQTSGATNSHTAGSASPESSLSAKTVSPSPVSSPAAPPPTNRGSLTSPAPPAPTPAARLDAKLPASPQPEIKPPAVHATARFATVKPPPPFTLLIRAAETTWVSLAADGKPIAHETLIAPAHTSIRATHEIVVRAGNSAGISFVLNGKEIPAQGNEGEVRTYTFDATGLQTIQTTTQQQPPAANR
jgi:cytoskeletal protein RodZ